MSRSRYAKTATAAARIRPVIQAFAAVATCVAAAWAGTLV
jgi:hypothetical protein